MLTASIEFGRVETLEKQKPAPSLARAFIIGAPTGIRTPVVALKGPRPSPLDDGGASRVEQIVNLLYRRGRDCNMRELKGSRDLRF